MIRKTLSSRSGKLLAKIGAMARAKVKSPLAAVAPWRTNTRVILPVELASGFSACSAQNTADRSASSRSEGAVVQTGR